ncbi:MAG TPA: metal-dependent hydrolase [Gemmataceae bacterium]|nr:metal-dependent hydrolase [Gemmataceae bacterium]
MASYQGHLSLSSILAAGYGTVGAWGLDLDWGPVFLGAGLTALGGLLPDLDSDSSVPVRELFGLAAVAAPFLLFERLKQSGLTTEETLVVLGGIYLFVRYVLAGLFKSLTVHRGMFHSIPAMLIAGLLVFLLYHSADHPGPLVRLYLAGGVMLGFLSHLVLDALYAVDFMGAKVHRSKYTGSVFKLFSPSVAATLTTYLLLGVLTYLAWVDLGL